MELSATALLAEPAAFAAGVAVLRVPPQAVRDRRHLALGVLAALSAGAAVAAGGSPTGWVPLDAVLLAALGATAVLAGSEASSGIILAAALAAAAAGLGSLALPLALAAVGLAFTSFLVEAEPLVDATAGGLVAQAALRLHHPGGRGLTALVAAAILVPLLVSGAQVLDRSQRRLLRRIALGLCAFAAVGAIGAGVAAATAVGPLRRGLDVATATVDATGSADLQTTSTGLARAGQDFAQARRALEAWWTVPSRAVPVVAQHWRVLHAAALTGDQLAHAGRQALGAPALNDVHVVDGMVPLDRLAAIQPSVASVAARATAARRRLEGAQSPWLVTPLADKLNAQLRRVRSVERSSGLASRALPLLPHLLGADGPRRYFLAVQSPDESRAGGGFMGNYGEITADGGRLRLTKFGRQDDLTLAPGRNQRTLAGPPEYLARYGRFGPALSWANVNLSPDFPTDAQVIADLYPQSGGAPVDGVIAVDPAGLAALLALVGPVNVASWPTPITADNALQTLLFDQYVRYNSNERVKREDFLGEVAQVAWRGLTSGELPPVPQILSSFGPTVRGKHLFLWSTRPDEQRLFEDMGAAGQMPPVADDFLGLVTQNATGNKIDYFLRRSMDYRVQLDPGSRKVQATARISLRNDAPASGIDQLIGNDIGLPIGTNKLYLSFYSPWQLVQGTIDGTPAEFEKATELGRQVYSAGVIIPPASTAVIELTLSGRMAASGHYRLGVYDQPVVNPDVVTTTLSLPAGWEGAGGNRSGSRAVNVQSDAVVELPFRRR